MTPSVVEFYKGKNILITGGTGFLGKVLIEKLLRSFPDIGTIYLLLRAKKGLTEEERLKIVFNNKVFANLREKQPDVFKKIKLVAGDVLDDNLGLSNDDALELRRNCNIVFHSAACVRFDQNLKDAVNVNIKGTQRILKLAETMEKIEAFVHLSTAYCRCKLEVLEEKLYPAVHSPAKIIDLVDWLDDKTLSYIEPKLISSEPNTYAYTKAMTEDLVAEYSSKFPIAIGRPSIVVAAWKEPLFGWVDNINGPTGLLIGSGKGVIRSMHCKPSYLADAIPVDIVVNGCILIAYTTALDRSKDVRIFNMTLSGIQKITWREIIELGKKWVNEYPFTVALWYPGGTIKSYWLTHQVAHILTHVLPAYFIDMLLLLLGKKTFMVNLQVRVSHGLSILQYYTTKQWHFKNTNFLSLQNRITKSENNIFYTDISTLDRDEYLKNYIIGTKLYVLNEDPDSLPRARKLHRMLYWIDVIAKALFYSLLLWFLHSKCGFRSMQNYLSSLVNIDQGIVEIGEL
ncbi:putative fatty acyl-CoA reductase CG5065 [Vanessa tameamea]|uniref:Fatty acyl-CoA reductase n=1 Tax=Vanessa tameamea TaxID=334116 RepID=A0A8B8HMB6_VANTA